MNKESNRYAFMFALGICVVCSFSLAAVSEGLRARKELNVALDIKKNILKAVALRPPLPLKVKPDELLSVYRDKIEEVVLNQDGAVVSGKKPVDIREGEQLFSLYIYKDRGQVMAYAFPIEGKGLWSTLYGYLAIEADGETIRGITFYKDGETPGLGAEIEKAWFQDNFKGKKIWDAAKQELRPTVVLKGKVAEKVSAADAPYYVDGISGATMTSKGVTALLDRWLRVYEPFLKTVRKG